MSGLLDGIAAALGGFNTVRRIDEEGFDFREKAAQAEFERQRAQEKARQADEDRVISQMGDVLVGQGDQPDLSAAESLIPQNLDRATRERALLVAQGQIPERKSSLEATKGYNRRLLEGDRTTGRLAVEQEKGRMRQELERVEEEIRANQQMSPREKEAALLKIQSQKELFQMAESGRNARFGQRLQFSQNERLYPVDQTEGSAVVRRYLTRDELRGQGGPGSEGFRKVGSTEMNRSGAAQNSLVLGESILEALRSPQIASKIGPAEGQYQSLSAAWGVGDPDFRRMQGELLGLAALQPQIHGFRNQKFVQEIQDYLLSPRQTPQALAAAIDGLLQASRVVQGSGRAAEVQLATLLPPDFKSQYAGLGEDMGGIDTDAAIQDLMERGLTPEQILQVLGEQ